VFYLIGSLLVFGSWVNLVPTWLGWVGWLMAMAGWAVGSITNRSTCRIERPPVQSLSRADEIAKLDLLRKEDVISEEEFQSEKRRILHGP
jgi:hypothetical protein